MRLEVEVLADGDVMRQERLTRLLYEEFCKVDGLRVQFSSREGVDTVGAKSAEVLTEASLWIFLGTATTRGSRVILAAINAWSAREKHRVVRLKMGTRTIGVPRHPSENQQRMVESLLRTDER